MTSSTDDALARLPLRDDLRGATPYGAPQLDVPIRLNTNENSYDVPPEVAAAVVAAVAEEAAHHNRYPDREFTALREAIGLVGSRVRTLHLAARCGRGARGQMAPGRPRSA